jgi:hypothetical protein
MAKRNPNSENQINMSILFGKKEAAKQSSDWHKWPEPQRSIYSRMLGNRYRFVPHSLTTSLKALLKTNSDFINHVMEQA